MHTETDLLTLQRRIMAAVREPIFGDSRERSRMPARQGDVSEEFVETADLLITPSESLRPQERLELYHRQYWYRLLDSLGEDFPALRELLGEDEFWGLLEAYIEGPMTSSFTLRHLGAGLADYVTANPHLVSHPVHAADLALLEYALCEIFEAGERPAVAAKQLASTEIALQPFVRLLALRTDADARWHRSMKEETQPPPAEAAPGPVRFVAISRHGLGRVVQELPRAACSLVEAIAETHSLVEAMERVTEAELLGPDDADQVGAWFADWVARGWFCTVIDEGAVSC